MHTVYGIQEPPPFYNRKTGEAVEKDLSSANRYGTVNFILNRKDRISSMAGQCRRKLEQGLKDFKPDDYIFFPGGDFTGLLMVGAILRDMGFREVKWLKWEKERATDGRPLEGGFYVPITIPL